MLLQVSGLVVQAPTSLGVVQNSNDLGLFREYYNTLTWTDSTTTNVIFYELYRDNIHVAKIPKGVSKYVDHNIDPTVSFTYKIVAVDNQFSLSEPVAFRYP